MFTTMFTEIEGFTLAMAALVAAGGLMTAMLRVDQWRRDTRLRRELDWDLARQAAARRMLAGAHA